MKLDGATIPIEKRQVGDCIDLAVLFQRQNFKRVIALAVLFAAPTSWLAYQWDASLPRTLLTFFMLSPFLGSFLVVATGRRAFGESFSLRTATRVILKRLPMLFVIHLLSRLVVALGLFVLLIPGLWLSVRLGFFSETILLEQLEGTNMERRASDLVRGTMWNLLMRQVSIVCFFFLFTLAIFMSVDLLSGFVLEYPIFFGRVQPLDRWFQEISYYLVSDPRVQAALNASLWLAYPLCRIAWFFCYLDVRIDKECWDIELDFRVEARRLETVSP